VDIAAALRVAAADIQRTMVIMRSEFAIVIAGVYYLSQILIPGITETHNPLSNESGPLQAWHQYRQQQRNDRYHHQEFY
jgi:hypothetical protein